MKSLLRRVITIAATPVTVIVVACVLARHLRTILGAGVMVVMEDGGFGHTVIGPDTLRRLHSGRRAVFLVFSEYGRHNPRLAAIWPDVAVVFVPVTFGVRLREHAWTYPGAPAVKALLARVLAETIRRFTGATVLTLLGMYDQVPIPPAVQRALRGRPLNFIRPVAYLHLQATTPAPRVGVPEPVRRRMERARERTAGGLRPLCGLYLRQRNSPEVFNRHRNGSRVAAYVTALRRLVHAGYQVGVVGDVRIPEDVLASFRGMVVTAASLRVDRDWFSMYVSTEADIFVGEAGGGVWLPGINGIPRLIVNAFPFSLGAPRAWLHYKTVRDTSGGRVPYTVLFASHGYDYAFDGLTVQENSSAEIDAAVESFLREIHSDDSGAGVPLPDDHWLTHVPGRVSSAWLALYDGPDDERALDVTERRAHGV